MQKPLDIYFVFNLFFLTCLLAIALADSRAKIIPDELLVMLFIILLILIPQKITDNLLSAIIPAFVFIIIYLISKQKALGYGDVKLIFILGLSVNLLTMGKILYLTFLTAGAVSAILLIAKKVNLKTAVAFGPFIIFSYLIFFKGL